MFFGQNGASSAAAPTQGQSPTTCQVFGSPGTCTFGGSVTAGQIIVYSVYVVDVTSTFTKTDNCNTAGSSDSYTIDAGPTNAGSVGRAEAGHATVGANTGSCTVTVAWTGASGVIDIVISTVTGSSGLDVVATFNAQSPPGSGTNAVTSNAVTTGFKDLCVAYSGDVNVSSGGPMLVGTNIAWTLMSPSGYPSGAEWFQQSAAGSITGTFTWTNGTIAVTLTGISCFKP